MKRLITCAVVLAVATGCSHLRIDRSGSSERTDLWTEAHQALSREDYPRAEASFRTIVSGYTETLEGRESLFYLGALHLDPRNPDWDPVLAQDWLEEYLAFMGTGGPRLYRYPEALTLHEIARQLNLPPHSRVEGLQPEERIVTIEERVLIPAEQSQELSAEIERLRQQLAEREARIQEQQEELERIRRTLTAPTRP